ncbi:MAG: T9SS type A sorting domain-containing protein [Ignavibacteria bacterium]|nr:T9SS type A sorting domain-containing protein [Ignavibacteria bacterium]
MKNIILCISTVLIFSNVYSQQNQTWKFLHPTPQGNSLRWLQVADQLHYFAGGDLGTFMKTTDGGVNWDVKTISIIPGDFRNLYRGYFTNKDTGIISTYQGILRTEDGGETFENVLSFTGTSNFPYSMSFINRDTGFTIIYPSFVLYKTMDGGKTWAPVSNFTINNFVNDLYAFDENYFIGALNNAPANYNYFRTTNGGASFDTRTITNGFIFDPMQAVNFINSNTGFVCGHSIFKTTDKGNSWATLFTTGASPNVKIISEKGPDSSLIILNSSGSYKKSTDAGLNFTDVNIAANTSNQFWTYGYSDIYKNGDLIVTVGGAGIINKSTNGGDNFTLLTNMDKGGSFNDITIIDDKIWAVGNYGNNPSSPDAILHSSDNGITWQRQLNDIVSLRSIDMLNSNTGYTSGDGSKIYKTTNGGQNWDTVSRPIFNSSISINKIKFLSENFGYAFGNSGKVFKTTNGGNNWEDLVTNSIYSFYAGDVIDENNLCAAGNVGEIIKSTNGGTNWINIRPLTSNQIRYYSIAMISSEIFYAAGESSTLLKTTNGGTNWTPIFVDSVSIILRSVNFYTEDIGYVVGDKGICLFTTNGGNTWNKEFSNTVNLKTVFIKNPYEIFAAGDNGCLIKKTNIITNINNNYISPGDFRLHQNYPNPFNPITKIRYSIPQSDLVKISVYNIKGQLIKTLVNEFKSKGTFEIEFRSNDLSSGVYYYRLIINDVVTDTKRMVVLK